MLEIDGQKTGAWALTQTSHLSKRGGGCLYADGHLLDKIRYLYLSKLVQVSSGLDSLREEQISPRTGGVAVAVSASTGTCSTRHQWDTEIIT